MEVLAPVGGELVSSMGISTLWSVVRCSPIAWHLSLQNVALAASAFKMLLRAISAEVFDVEAANLARSRRCSCLRWYTWRLHSSREKHAAWRQWREYGSVCLL